MGRLEQEARGLAEHEELTRIGTPLQLKITGQQSMFIWLNRKSAASAATPAAHRARLAIGPY
jgi:hypothetical protein